MPDLIVEFDRADIDRLIAGAKRTVEGLPRELAELLAEDKIPDEAPKGATGKLSEPWQTERESDLEWRVFANDEAFYAHMVAGGTRDHGPRSAQAMRIGDRWVEHVRGVPANPFDKRAGAATEREDDDVLKRVLLAEGL